MNKMTNAKPKEYLEQGIRYCGGYTIKAILSAYGMDDGKHPKKYLPSINKSLGFTTPKTIQRVLKKYKIKSQIKIAHDIPYNEKLKLIKREIDKNNFIILLIGNGYSKNGEYSWLKQKLIAHWITIWGYDDKKRVFYIYDSYNHKKEIVPIGNVKRDYLQLLRDWKGAAYTNSYLYITISKK